MIAGPPLEQLTRRLAETPAEFLGEPRIGGSGSVATAALVGDLLRGFGMSADRATLDRFAGNSRVDRNRLMLVAVATWLIADEWFRDTPLARDALVGLLTDTIAELAQATAVTAFVEDAERREELARTTLATLGFCPEGETEQQAADRLSAVSATERQRLLRASRDAEARARAVREALIRKAAEESADKYTRE